MTYQKMIVQDKKQLDAALALIEDGPALIQLERADGRVTLYRFPKRLSAKRIRQIRSRLARTPAAAFR